MERRPRCTQVSTGREMREQPQARVEQVGACHDIYRARGAVVYACIGKTQVEALLDTGATTDRIRTNVAQNLLSLRPV